MSLFRILVVWWVRWTQKRRIWRNWILIRVSWYIWYLIGWVVAWRTIAFRSHTFYWWFMRWWWRVTCCPISKYLWIRYQKRCFNQMYQRHMSISSCRQCMICCILRFTTHWQYIFYWLDISWIIDWSDVFIIGWNELIQARVIWIDVNWVWVFVISIYRMFVRNFFSLKIISRSAFSKLLLPPKFNLSLFAAPCHKNNLYW